MSESPLTQRLIDFGAMFSHAINSSGVSCWRLFSADGPLERGGNANIYVDVLDEQGKRLAGVPVRFYWNGGEYVSRTELKPGEPDQGTNMNMSAGGNAYGVMIDDGKPSDFVFGMGMVPFEKHKSYRVVFQRAVAPGIIDTSPQVPSVPPSVTGKVELRIDGVVVYHN